MVVVAVEACEVRARGTSTPLGRRLPACRWSPRPLQRRPTTSPWSARTTFRRAVVTPRENQPAPTRPPPSAKPPKRDSHLPQVKQELEEHRKVMVAMTAPAVRVAIGEELGIEPGTVATPQLVTALRQLGFDYVFDVCSGADLTILEEGTELIGRLSALARGHPGHRLPMFTSCCPGWIGVVESCYPQLVPHLSTCKSPSAMMGAVIKGRWAPLVAGHDPDDISLVSVMPCVRKQGEADRPWMQTGGARDIDHVVTTRELGEMLRGSGLTAQSFADLPPGQYDSPLGSSSGGAALFGTTGGVTEAALRVVYEVCTGEPMPALEYKPVRGMEALKEATVEMVPKAGGPLGDQVAGKTIQLKVAVVHGLKNVKQLVSDMQEGSRRYHFVEVMACPGGCIAGAGQPVSKDRQAPSKRQAALYQVDKSTKDGIHHSAQNPDMDHVYSTWLPGGPGAEPAHQLLHTHYVPGGVDALTDQDLARSASRCALQQAREAQLLAPTLGPGFPEPKPPLASPSREDGVFSEEGEGGGEEGDDDDVCAALFGPCLLAEEEFEACAS